MSNIAKWSAYKFPIFFIMKASFFSTGDLKAALWKMNRGFFKKAQALGLDDCHGPFRLQSSPKSVWKTSSKILLHLIINSCLYVFKITTLFQQTSHTDPWPPKTLAQDCQEWYRASMSTFLEKNWRACEALQYICDSTDHRKSDFFE